MSVMLLRLSALTVTMMYCAVDNQMIEFLVFIGDRCNYLSCSANSNSKIDVAHLFRCMLHDLLIIGRAQPHSKHNSNCTMSKQNNRAAKQAYDSYLDSFASDNSNVVQTKQDKQFDAVLHLREDSDRLSDVTGMVERWSEHRKNASSGMNSNSSKFGDTYPSRNSARASGVDGRCFEDLNQYAAAAFEPTDTAFDLFQKDFDIGGLFCWAPSEKDIVCRTKISGCSNDGHKFAAVVAYGFEMCYDIAISRRDNLSESPGFEAFGLMHGG